jgi:parvulin-like peptidyl-prolyl isomerase
MAKKSMWMALFALVAVLMTVMTTVVAAGSPSASASHILVPTEAEVDQLLVELEAADDLTATFAELAKSKSKCPSSRNGGALGTFGRNQMVEEFDKVVFEKPVGVVHKVRTQFGWHLVLTTSRSGMPEDLDEDVEDMKADL